MALTACSARTAPIRSQVISATTGCSAAASGRPAGGPGSDFISGGDGDGDYVHYTAVTAPLRVTLGDGLANDGAANEHDNAQPDLEVVVGGAGDDRLVGHDGANELWGRGGDDVLVGGASDDRLEGESGDDRLEGGYHADLLNGGPGGADTVDYSWHSYTDTSTGEVFGVTATLDGGADDGNHGLDFSATGEQFLDTVGTDVENLDGSDGPDLLSGDGDPNRLLGAAGHDDVLGAAGGDVVDGQAGEDTLDPGLGTDLIRGGDGIDLASYAGRPTAVYLSLDNTANDGALGEADNIVGTIENLTGGSAADLLVGNGLENRLVGAGGDDTLEGRLGSDTVVGGGGSDTISYGERGAGQAVAVTLDGLRNDGADPDGDGSSTLAEEGDRDLAIENAVGGAGHNSLTAVIAEVRSSTCSTAAPGTTASTAATALPPRTACSAATAWPTSTARIRPTRRPDAKSRFHEIALP